MALQLFSSSFCSTLPKLPSPIPCSVVRFISSKKYCRSSPCQVRCMLKTTDHQIVRRSANYQTSMWNYDYVLSLTSNYLGDPCRARADKLKADVRMMLEKASKHLDSFELIDILERLGLVYHFKEEVQRIMGCLYNDNHIKNVKRDHDDLYATALKFLLLRQHGYTVPQELFNHFKDEQGNFKACLRDDVKGMLYLYEASYMLVEGESILEQARDFTAENLKNYANNCVNTSEYLPKLVGHALELPLAWRMLRLEAPWFINVYDVELGFLHVEMTQRFT